MAYGNHTSRKWGWFNGWKKAKIVDLILSLQDQSAQNYLNQMLRSDQITKIDFESDTPLSVDDTSLKGMLIAQAEKDFTRYYDSLCNFFDETSMDEAASA